MGLPLITSTTLENAVLHAVAKSTLDTGNTANDVVNHALQYLASYKGWNWRFAALSLDFVQSQSYVALPADFEELISVTGANNTFNSVVVVSLDDINKLRQATSWTGTVTYVAVSETTQASAGAAPIYRLEIFPTPAAALSGAIIGTYRKAIPTIATTSVPNIPSAYHYALLTLCRAFGKLFEMGDPGPEWQIAHDELDRLVIRDGVAQPTLGRMRGTAERPSDWMSSNDRFYPFSPISV